MPNQNQKLISQANELRDMITIHPVFNDAQTQKAQSLQAFIGEGTRNGIQALLMAMAFSLVAGLRSGNHGIGGLILDLLDFGELLDACSAKPWGASKRLRKAHSLDTFPGQNGAGGTRTHDLRFRKPSLYPAELQPHNSNSIASLAQPQLVRAPKLSTGAVCGAVCSGSLLESRLALESRRGDRDRCIVAGAAAAAAIRPVEESPGSPMARPAG